MAQLSTAYIMMVFSFLNVVMLLYILANHQRRPVANSILLVSVLVTGWSISITLRSLAVNTDIAIFFHELKFIASALLPVAVLVIVMNHIGLGRLIQLKQITALSLIPIFTIILSQTNPWHHIFRKGFEIIYQPDGAFYINTYNNYWFYVHCIYTYALWIVSIFFLARFFVHKSTRNRLQTGIYIIAVIFPLITNFLDLFGWVKAYDLTIFALTVSVALFLYGVFFYSDYDLMPVARIKLVDSLPSPIFIYNREFRLNDANRAAVKLAGRKMKDMYGQRREQIMNSLPIRQVQREGLSYWLVDLPHAKKRVLSLESQSVSRNKDIAAHIDIFTDVTALESANRKIRKMAIIDGLTGLYNRNFFDESMRCLEQEGGQTAIIIGDVDGLKKVNDNYGHARGDEVIRRTANAIKCAVCGDDVVARIGGDEFVVLLKEVDPIDIHKIMDRIRANCEELSENDIPLSICLGYAIREDENQSLTEVFRLADQDMYSRKRGRLNESEGCCEGKIVTL